jgi:ligand-binding sensor domain-containing protein
MRELLHLFRTSMLAIMSLFLCNAVFGQAYNFNQVSLKEGLPQSQAFAITFDSFERAWIGTQGGGLCIYDGSVFKYITKNDSLISNRIFCIKKNEKEIWIGQRGGVSVYSENGKWRGNYRLDFASQIINDICFNNDQTLLATDAGLYVVRNNQITKYTDNSNLTEANCQSFFTDETEQVWVCTSDGMLNLNDPFNKINKARGLPVNEVNCAFLFNGSWLIGTYGSGLVIYDKNHGIYQPDYLEFLSEEIITALNIFENKEIWIGTQNNGVYVLNTETLVSKNYRTENGLANNHIRTIVADRWNNIWIGTSGGGISIFQNSPFIKYSTESGLNGNYIYAVLNDDQNNLWLGTEGTGVMRINDTSATLFDEEFGFCSDKVRSIFQDKDGDIWFGTESSGFGVYDRDAAKDTILYFTQQKGALTSNWIKCFAENKETGEIFISTVNGGILRVTKSKTIPLTLSFSKIKISEGKYADRISCMFFFNDKLWFIGEDNSFGFIDGKNVVTKYKEDVSFRNAAYSENVIWIGTTDNGILQLKMKGDSVENETWITASDRLSSNNIYQLIYHKSELWVGTEKGLDKLEFDDEYKISQVTHFDSDEGFEGVETNSNAAYADDFGNLWFGTVNGLFVYKGGEVNYSRSEPPFLILEDFRIFYESIEKTEFADFFEDGRMTKNLLLPHDQNHIGFSFNAIHYTHANSIRYRWKLSGVDKDWTPSSTSHEATYGNLFPGKYSFSVQASIDDNWEVEPITISFEIDQPYWEKWWFKFMYYSAISLLIIIVFIVVVVRLKRKNKRLREKFEMEKNLIELEQKALRLQMNPHFIFNVLNSIHNLIILNDSDKARYALAKFSKLMRQVLENSREKAISIDSEIETLENYVQLERLTSGVDVDLEFEIDPDLVSSEEVLPPLLIQPFVENALIHGLKKSERKGVIRVAFKLLSEHLLECSIEDNGIGRENASKLIAQKENYHKSTALKVTEERLASLNKNSGFIPFEIIDLKDDSGNPAGTKIILRIQI